MNETDDDFRFKANALRVRLVAFKDWLNTLHGATQTRIAEAGKGFGLWLVRKSSAWTVFCSETPDDADIKKWTPLASASIAQKIRSVPLLPCLVEALKKAQSERNVELEKATEAMDEFLATLPPGERTQIKPKPRLPTPETNQ